MKKRKISTSMKGVLTILLCLMSFSVFAQTKTVTGTVVDKQNEPLIGVTVKVQGTSIGKQTDINGAFTLKNVPENGTLVISYIGMKMQSIPVAGKSVFNVVLQDDSEMLNEVVVVGFGTQKKVNLTGSVSTVDAKVLKERPVTSAAEALQGVVPGLNITSTGEGGQLNATKAIDIRGGGTIGSGSGSSPLILIDGMEGDINAINPQDIDNISVLKDAAASSIYGSRAPFGVILITTKKGKEGKLSVNYNNNFRFDSPIRLPKMADSYSFALYFNDASLTGDQYTDAKLKQIKDYRDGLSDKNLFINPANNKFEIWDNLDLLPAGNTDWVRTQYKDNTFSQEHNLSLSGGTEKFNFYVSGNFLNKDGLLRYGDEDFSRYTSTIKLNAKINQYVSMGYSNRFVREDYLAPSFLNNLFFHNTMRYWPTIPLKDPNGHYTEPSMVYQMRESGKYKSQSDWNYQQFNLNIQPLKDWRIIAELNYKTSHVVNHRDNLTAYAYDASENPYVVSNNVTSVSEYFWKSNFFNPNIYSDYTLNLESGHNFKVMAGFQSELNYTRNFGASRKNILSPDVPTLKTATDDDKVNGGGYDQWATAGFFGRLNYNYKERYLLEVNGRYDGSSRFLSDKRWRFFPSFSLGWNVAREAFWEDYINTVSNLKIRGSWGELGNQNTNNWYPFYQSMPISPKSGNWLLNGKKPTTSYAPGLVSSLLTWENVRSWNVGLDLTMLNNRLNLTFDYFNRQTLNMVGPAPKLPDVLGAGEPRINNADLESKGFELSVSWRDRIGEFSYGAAFNLSDAKRIVTRYPNPSGNIGDWYAGRSTGEIWGYTTVGIAKTQEEMDAHLAKVDQSRFGSNWTAGDIMYADLDGDGKITAGTQTLDNTGDYRIIGDKTPRFRFGLSLDAAYKGFDVRMFLQGVAKRDYNAGGPIFWGADGGKWQSVAFVEHMDYFRNDPKHPLGLNLDSYYPRANWGDGKNRRTQTRYLQNAAYMRLKNLQLGYTVDQNITQKFGINALRVFVSGENLLTLTPLSKLFDPETLDGAGWGNGKTYPLARTLSFGLSLTF